jgi:hypothetical protein
MQVDPAVGLAVCKLFALALGGLCLWLNTRHPMRWIDYWYAGLVVWNMALIVGVLRAG